MERVNVLVVDHNDDARAFLKEYVSTHERVAQVWDAKDGSEMRALLKAHMVQLVITELVLPGGDPLMLLEEMFPEAERPGAIVVSAMNNEHCFATAIRHGAPYFMVKPIDPPRLGRYMNNLLTFLEDPASGELTVEIAFPSHTSYRERTQRLLKELHFAEDKRGYDELLEMVAYLSQSEVPEALTELVGSVAVAIMLRSTPERVQKRIHKLLDNFQMDDEVRMLNRILRFLPDPEEKPRNHTRFIYKLAEHVRITEPCGQNEGVVLRGPVFGTREDLRGKKIG